MTDLPATRTLAENRARFARLEKAAKGPKASFKTRVALVAHDRRLTKRQLAKFQKGRRFDFVGFAEAYHVSLDWLLDGDLRMHPRAVSPSVPKAAARREQMQEFRQALKKLDEKFLPLLLAQLRNLAGSQA